MMATCRDLGVWPQNVDASEKSCNNANAFFLLFILPSVAMAWQDTSEPLDKIALALYNQQHNVADSEGYQVHLTPCEDYYRFYCLIRRSLEQLVSYPILSMLLLGAKNQSSIRVLIR